LISSMTGYAEDRVNHKIFSARISIKTLNHRYFDWNYYGERIGDIEDRLRKICRQSIFRGKVDVFLDIDFFNSSIFDFRFNQSLLKKIYNSFQEIDEDIQKKMKIRLENLFDIPHLIELKPRNFSEKEVEFLENAFRSTLEMLLEEKRKEGERLLKGIKEHLNEINSAVVQIEKRAEKQPGLIRKKLLERIERLSRESDVSEERIAEETVLYAQRFDLDEEIERINSHLQYFRSLLSDKIREPVGKKLDFASQEILRETNTISSKTQDIEITKNCLEIKCELESIRQQIRNLE